MGDNMNRRLFIVSSAVLAALSPAALAQNANSRKQNAKTAVAEACTQAQASNRSLMLVFHASWCGYCTLLDRMLADQKCAPIVEAYFQVFHLRALEEKKDKIALQLAGADDVYASYAPAGAGLPYVVMLDGNAGKIADSILPSSGNIGFPVTPEELAGFETMLKTAAPAITAQELGTLRKTCVALMKT